MRFIRFRRAPKLKMRAGGVAELPSSERGKGSRVGMTRLEDSEHRRKLSGRFPGMRPTALFDSPRGAVKIGYHYGRRICGVRFPA